jgi:hypothetical protein
MRQTPTSGNDRPVRPVTVWRQVQSGGGASDTHQIVGQDSLEPLAIGALPLQTTIYDIQRLLRDV